MSNGVIILDLSPQPSEEVLREVVKTLLLGLTTDGARHKQWYLEQALRTLCMDEWVNNAEAYFKWQKGIPD